MSKDTNKWLKATQRQLKTMMTALVIEFILGISLTTIINYDPTKHTVVQTSFLVAHIVLAVIILVGAVARIVIATKAKFLQAPAIVGFGSIIGAFTGGVIAANSGSGVAIFFMALCFLIAFISYGYSLGKVMSGSP